jgi:hypothetical protein
VQIVPIAPTVRFTRLIERYRVIGDRKPLEHFRKPRINELFFLNLCLNVVFNLASVILADAAECNLAAEFHRRSGKPQRVLEPTFHARDEQRWRDRGNCRKRELNLVGLPVGRNPLEAVRFPGGVELLEDVFFRPRRELRSRCRLASPCISKMESEFEILVRANWVWHGRELSMPVGQANRGGSLGAVVPLN